MSECTDRNCCACCMEQGAPPFFSAMGRDPRYEALPDEMKGRIQVVRSAQDWKDGVPCVWLNVATRKCVYYKLRPDICRVFEVDSDECKRWRGRVAG